MPKGDRLKLKADPDDGTTPIANLLLEAVAMAKISGLQKGAIIHIWRETYGWIANDGKRQKEAKITLGDWKKALDRDKSRISKALAELENMNIIHRRVSDIWGGYYYTINTDISSWNSNSINLSKLAEIVTVAHLPTVDENATVAEMPTVVDNCNSGGNVNSSPKRNATVGENATQQLAKTPHLTISKEILKKYKEIYIVWNNSNIIKHNKLTDEFKRAINTALRDYSEDDIEQAIKNYAEILKGEQYYFKYKWTLKDFLKRGLTKFLDLDIAKSNYLKDDGKKTAQIKKPSKHGDGW